MKVNLIPFSIYWITLFVLSIVCFFIPSLFLVILPVTLFIIPIWFFGVFEIGKLTVLSSQCTVVMRVAVAFITAFLTVSILPIEIIIENLVNWGHISGKTILHCYSKEVWIVFVIHMILFWAGEETGVRSQKKDLVTVKNN